MALTQGENTLQAAKRELEEETGLVKDVSKFEYLGHIHFVGGYKDDWVTFFYRVLCYKGEYEKSKEPKLTSDGRLVWLTAEEFIVRKDVVPDLEYIREDILKPHGIFFMTSIMGREGKTIEKGVIDRLVKS